MTWEHDWAHVRGWFSVCVSGSAPAPRSALITFSLLANVFQADSVSMWKALNSCLPVQLVCLSDPMRCYVFNSVCSSWEKYFQN